MKAPKCKVCGTEHYGMCRYSAKQKVGDAHTVSRAVDAADIARNTKAPTVLPVKLDQAPQTQRDTSFDRKAYQRDYMRDKRAADKLGLTVAEYRKKNGTPT